MTTPPADPQPADPEHIEAWRAAVLAYRKARQWRAGEDIAHQAAIDAYLLVRPRDDREEARRQVVRAIAYAAAHHTAWFWRGVSAILGLILLTAPAAAAGRCEPGPHVGAVTHVRAGDTIEVAGLPIRLQGLAAPELNEPGGEEAARAMWLLLHSQDVRCELTGERNHRNHDRCIGVCFLDGADVAAELVRAGVARDCPRFSGGRYADEELEAARDGADIAEAYRLPGSCRTR